MINFSESNKKVDESFDGSFPSMFNSEIEKLINKYGFKNFLWVVNKQLSLQAQNYTKNGEDYFRDNKNNYNDLLKLSQAIYKFGYSFDESNLK